MEATHRIDALAKLEDATLVDKQFLADAFNVSTKTIDRMGDRGELPPHVVTIAGRRHWLAGRIRSWLEWRAEGKEAEVKEARARARVL